MYLLHGGKLANVTEGSKYALYAPGKDITVEANRLALGTVQTNVQPFTAVIKVTKVLDNSAIKTLTDAVAVETVHSYPPASVFVDRTNLAI